MAATVKNVTIFAFIICLVQISAIVNAQKIHLNSYIHAGLLLTPPTAEELGYMPPFDGKMEDYLTMHPFNYGFGVQGLFGFDSNPKFRVGFDLGFGSLFNDTYILNDFDSYYKYTNKESSIKLLLLFEVIPVKRVFFIAGAGPDLVIRDWTYIFNGLFNGEDKTGRDLRVNFGLMTACGISLFKNDKLSVPIILRLDYLFRYGIMLSANISTGVTFSF